MLGQAAEQPRGAALLALAQEQLPVSVLLRPGNAESAAIHMMGVRQRPDMLLQALNPSDDRLPGSEASAEDSLKCQRLCCHIVRLSERPHVLLQACDPSRIV